jgi:DNA polymerase-3 subunit beta
VPVHSDDHGSVVVPARLVSDIVRALPAGAVEVSLGDEEMSISAGRSQFSVRPLSLSDYPAQAEASAEPVTLQSSEVAEALRQVVRAASTDDARAVLTGVLIAAEDDGVKMVATDSYRLAVRDLPQSTMLASGQRVLVPGRALAELQRILSTDAELTVPQDSTPVRMTLTNDSLQLTAITQDVGNAHEEIDAGYDGAEMTVAFNPDYLASGIDAVEGDEVTLATIDPMKPAVLRGVGHDDYLYLLMPVRVP